MFDGSVTALPRPHRDDVLIAVAGFLGGLLLWSLGLDTHDGQSSGPRTLALLPLAVMSGAELLRRTMPNTALTIGCLTILADEFTPGNIATIAMFTDLVYAAVLYGTPAAARRVPAVSMVATAAVTVTLLVIFQDAEAVLFGLFFGVLTVAPAWTGVSVRTHRDAAEAAHLRAEQTALLAEVDRTQAVTAERARMARELHDLVAGHLSAIAIHSTAALSIDDPKTSRDALGVIRENSVEGLAEMRRLIGLLRERGDDAEPAAAPTLAGVDALLDQARTNGASSGLEFTLTDTRDTGLRLPAPVELAAYRIIQESLTNALKHASPGEVRVGLGRDKRLLTVRITSPYGDRPGPRAPGSGAGLVGMRERVALLDGEFRSGPVSTGDGGKSWQVRAELPLDEGDEGNGKA
ncbi:two-component sensor histidine kinase [Streptomyces lunaelactis]|uniref:sensor histidine kinase n=1 Tax=Streptomyces lunaelactis TaxID=1535768 RepID=UPI0015855BDD|nr:histidine kinase [Streptomyces lunaelactis]NUK51811.1 two-component sensor histidine kinase [Streptomyces lunaelactis]